MKKFFEFEFWVLLGTGMAMVGAFILGQLSVQDTKVITEYVEVETKPKCDEILRYSADSMAKAGQLVCEINITGQEDEWSQAVQR